MSVLLEILYRPTNPGYTDRNRLGPYLFSNTTESLLKMNLQLVLFAMGLLTACLPSGKMEGADLGLEVKECEGLEKMTLVYHPHHLLYI